MANQRTDPWGDPEVVIDYATDGYIDAGERAALEHIAPKLSGARFLDIGIGGGRTSGMLADRVAEYRGIDISPGMLDLARSRFPDLDLRLGDASALTEVEDASQDLLLFSLNGLDCLDREGRIRALGEFARVLKPGGRAIVSTFSLDGPSYDEKPGRRHWRSDLGVVRGVRRWVEHRLTPRAQLAEERAAYRAAASGIASGDGWATAPAAAHGFRFLLLYSRFDVVVRDLDRAGFDLEAAWDPIGNPIGVTAKRTEADYFYVVAVRR